MLKFRSSVLSFLFAAGLVLWAGSAGAQCRIPQRFPGASASSMVYEADVNKNFGDWGTIFLDADTNGCEVTARDFLKVKLQQQNSLAIERAIRKLQNLNQQAACSTNSDGSEWLTWGIEKLGAQGITWRSSAEMGENHLTSRAPTWLQQAKRLDGRATCHGDVHLKNILVSDDIAPVFIDYCLSGPGHPCYDLVRLDAAILYKIFRIVDDENIIAELLRAIVIDGASFSDVESLYPHITQSAANKLSIKSTIAIRHVCLEILKFYNGDLTDYLSMQGLVACQALTMASLQNGTVRAMLRALR